MKRTSIFVALASALAFSACSDATAPLGEQELQVRIRVLSGGVAPGASFGAAAAAVDVVEIDNVIFVLGGLKLETAGLDDTVDWVFEESVVIPLDLTGTPVLAFDTSVPAGIYKELEVSIDKLEVGNPAEDLLIDEWPELADASVLVEGTVTRTGGGTEPFAFTAPLDVDLELLYATPVEFPDAADLVSLVSLVIDLDGWFAGAAGVLDPTDPADQSDIEGNIEASLDIFEDD